MIRPCVQSTQLLDLQVWNSDPGWFRLVKFNIKKHTILIDIIREI